MKKSDLKQIIKEEVKKVMNDEKSDLRVSIFINALEWHRVIKGDTTLKIKIEE
jgi:hypothetical protein